MHHYLHEDQGVQIIEAAYICYPEDDFLVKLSEEHQAYKWVNEEELATVQPMTEKMPPTQS